MPAIIQFCNGNSIVNTYNAEGVKLSSTYYTLPEAVAVPVGEIVEPDTQPQSQQIMTVRYFGHMDETTTTDTLYYTLHTTEGYIAGDSHSRHNRRSFIKIHIDSAYQYADLLFSFPRSIFVRRTFS